MNRPLLITLVSLFLCCFAATSAFAQTQLEMNEQAQRAAQKADDQLNITYKALLADLDEPAQAKLKAAQREWIKFRDAECEFAADAYRGGSIMPLIYATCKQELTEKRTAELRSHIKSRKEP